ncbi:hypothetical protein Patl1_22409 [Pistacia atlantica]|uniref:Uncharacterized protein n=1 Tax=Pistacia atlantica TaxID=434234 RepID=A0ACC0ZZI8_9ROSI|nr:hypothetical protein Patl1_22409 [Pistacia atlantica]
MLDARIMSWLLGSVEPHIVTNLQAHHSTQSMWNYLKKVYHQDNDAHRFQLEHAIAMFQHDVPVAALLTIQNLHKTSQRDQFLMKLRPEYESVCSSLLNDLLFPLLIFVLVSYFAKNKVLVLKLFWSNLMAVPRLQLWLMLPMDAQAFQTSIAIHPAATFVAHGSSSSASSDLAPLVATYCTPKMAYNHMTNTPITRSHVRHYAGQSSIQTANGSSLPISAVGNASSTFIDVFLAPQLSTNFISVSQLVDNNCAVNFFGDG